MICELRLPNHRHSSMDDSGFRFLITA